MVWLLKRLAGFQRVKTVAITTAALSTTCRLPSSMAR